MGYLLRKILLLTIPAVIAFSDFVDSETAAQIAGFQITVMNARMDGLSLHSGFSIDHTITRHLENETCGSTVAYVFELEPEGFVVVTADDALVPVICYSERGSFPWDEHPENHLLNMLREDLRLRMEAVDLTDAEILADNLRLWEGMLAGDQALLDPGDSWPPEDSTETGGWVQTTWHQDSPYNDLCPIDTVTGSRCIVGCVATAMAQIVNYWQYPSSITFTEEDNYYSYSRFTGFQTEVFAPNASIPMIDYNDGIPSNEMCAAISFACGVGAKMNYSSTGSGASYYYASIAFHRYLDFLYASHYGIIDAVEFYIQLERNIKDSIPAMLAIDDTISNSRHAIICDGLRENINGNEWHLNYGWGYSAPDCWYMLPEGMPADFHIISEGILNIVPPTKKVTEPATIPYILDCYPNPFRSSIRINIVLPEEEEIEVTVYDINGNVVKKLPHNHLWNGVYSTGWNGLHENGELLPSGVYLISVKSSSYHIAQKVIHLKRDSYPWDIWN